MSLGREFSRRFKCLTVMNINVKSGIRMYNSKTEIVYWPGLHFSFALVVMATIPEGNHSSLRPVFKGESRFSCRIGDKDVLSTRGVFSPDILGLVNV